MPNLSERIIAEARGLLGVRFVHQGRNAAHGVDCLGLLLVVASRCGVRFHGVDPLALHTPDYRTRPDAAFLRAELARLLQEIPCEIAQAGDVVLLEIDGAAQHLALLADYPLGEGFSMIHAYAPARKVVEHRYDAHWQASTVGVFRVGAGSRQLTANSFFPSPLG